MMSNAGDCTARTFERVDVDAATLHRHHEFLLHDLAHGRQTYEYSTEIQRSISQRHARSSE